MTESLTGFTTLSAGFRDPVADAQSVFRRILDATAHPGRIVEIPAGMLAAEDSGLSIGAAALALTLLDFETPVWLDPHLSRAGDFIRFHCGAPVTTRPGDSRFAFAAEAKRLPDLASFDLGTADFPERSTTLLIEVPALDEAAGLRLRGPGIAASTPLRIDGVPTAFWKARADLADLFPLGIDLVFASGRRIAAVPRTTMVEV